MIVLYVRSCMYLKNKGLEKNLRTDFTSDL